MSTTTTNVFTENEFKNTYLGSKRGLHILGDEKSQRKCYQVNFINVKAYLKLHTCWMFLPSKNLHACSFSISQPILFASILSLISLPYHVFNNKTIIHFHRQLYSTRRILVVSNRTSYIEWFWRYSFIFANLPSPYHTLRIFQLTICLLVNLACRLAVCWLFSKSTLSKNYFRNTIRVSNSVDPDQARHFVGSDLGQKLFANNIIQRSWVLFISTTPDFWNSLKSLIWVPIFFHMWNHFETWARHSDVKHCV